MYSTKQTAARSGDRIRWPWRTSVREDGAAMTRIGGVRKPRLSTARRRRHRPCRPWQPVGGVSQGPEALLHTSRIPVPGPQQSPCKGVEGVEPSTVGSEIRCSPTELSAGAHSGSRTRSLRTQARRSSDEPCAQPARDMSSAYRTGRAACTGGGLGATSGHGPTRQISPATWVYETSGTGASEMCRHFPGALRLNQLFTAFGNVSDWITDVYASPAKG